MVLDSFWAALDCVLGVVLELLTSLLGAEFEAVLGVALLGAVCDCGVAGVC